MENRELLRELAKSLESTGRLAEKLTAEIDKLAAAARQRDVEVSALRTTLDAISLTVRGAGSEKGLTAIVEGLRKIVESEDRRRRHAAQTRVLILKIAGGGIAVLTASAGAWKATLALIGP